MTDSERLTAVLNHYNFTANAFYLHIGLKSPQSLYDILNGRNGISKRLAEKITAKCVEIDRVWLLTGSGQMLTNVKDVKSGPNNENILLHSEDNVKSDTMEKIILQQVTLCLTKINQLEQEVDQLKKELGNFEERIESKHIKSSG